MKLVYFCTGGCKGESEVSGACNTKGCSRHKKPLTKTYQCEECGMHYLDEDVAKKCEEWCKKYNSCHIDYIKQALENQPQGQTS